MTACIGVAMVEAPGGFSLWMSEGQGLERAPLLQSQLGE